MDIYILYLFRTIKGRSFVEEIGHLRGRSFRSSVTVVEVFEF